MNDNLRNIINIPSYMLNINNHSSQDKRFNFKAVVNITSKKHIFFKKK